MASGVGAMWLVICGLLPGPKRILRTFGRKVTECWLDSLSGWRFLLGLIFLSGIVDSASREAKSFFLPA